jgi:hypothetical protein
MADELKRGLLALYRAFSSPINTLLAQALIASLLFGIGTVAYAQIPASSHNPTVTIYESSAYGW